MRPAWMQSASVRSWSRPNRDLTSAKMRSDAAEDGTNVKTLFAALAHDGNLCRLVRQKLRTVCVNSCMSAWLYGSVGCARTATR
eukprot:7378776-Prymnesium_polylepis.1